jgi:IS605 OrfB family transposase
MAQMASPSAKIMDSPTLHRSIRTFLPASLSPACSAVSRHLRDVQNTAVHLARTAFNAFEWDRQKKSWGLASQKMLPDGWKEVVRAFDDAVATINADRSEKALQKGTKPLLLPSLSSLKVQPSTVILNMTVFHMVVRTWPDGKDAQKRPAYSRVPSAFAKPACETVRESFLAWLRGVSVWHREDKAGRSQEAAPQMPGYAKKNSLPTFHVFVDGTILPRLRRFDVRVAESPEEKLSIGDVEAFSKFGLMPHVERALRAWQDARGSNAEAIPKMLMITPGRQLARMDIIVTIPDAQPEGSFLHELRKRFPQEWALKRDDKDLMEDWFRKLARDQTWNARAMDPQHDHAWISERFEALGVDPGQNNLASMASSGGGKMQVFCGKGFERKVASFDRRIDKLAAQLTTQEQRDLASKIERKLNEGSQPEAADLMRRRELAAAVWRDPRLLALRHKKQNYRKDQTHRLARAIARTAHARKTALVMFSRNKGLKKSTAKTSGPLANRRAGNIAHNLLAQLLRDKLWELGIGMIEQEESFTSQSSFMDGDPLPSHGEGQKQTRAQQRKVDAKRLAVEKKSKTKTEQLLTTSVVKNLPKAKEGASPEEAPLKINLFEKGIAHGIPCVPSPSFSGKRDASDRNWFVRPGPLDARGFPRNSPQRSRLHADGQAALNAIRKVCPCFAFSKKLSLSHEVMLLRNQGWMRWQANAKLLSKTGH